MPDLPLVKLAHSRILEVVKNSDTVIDATVGNGHDTLFLARAVGQRGKVFGFDVQKEALDHTWRQLQEHGMDRQVSLYHAGHEIMSTLLPEQLAGRVQAIMFNLGYLPGGNKSRITRAATTLAAVQTALQMLSAGGKVTVMAYTGHPGGQQEASAVRHWASALPPDLFNIEMEIPRVTAKPSPELITITKKQKRPGLSVTGVTMADVHKYSGH